MKIRRILLFMLALTMCLGLATPAAAYDMGTEGMYVTISCGENHTAAIDVNGALWTWGQNSSGQLGNDTRTDSKVPVKVMDNVISVSCGTMHTAAIKSDGSLWTWGINVYGQLGTGVDTYDTSSNVPVKVMDDVKAVSCGSNFTAALKTDGSLWMWGYNATGEIGNNGVFTGTYENQVKPVKVLSDVVAVSCGASHTAAVTSDGSLWIWGLNIRGELGNGWTGNSTNYLGWNFQTVPVKLMDNVATVSCGCQSTAVIKTDGSLWMWGANGSGQLGNGRTGNAEYLNNPIQTVPIKVMDNAAAVSCGNGFTAAVKSDGSLWMWGGNLYGQVGNGGISNDGDKGDPRQTVPTQILDEVAAVSCGNNHIAAVKPDGTLWLWGSNRYGQLGNGGTGNAKYFGIPIQTVPVQVLSGMAVPKSTAVTTQPVPTSPTVAGFTDVHESDYYAQAVAWAKENGVTSGTSTTTFSPAATVTRAEAVTFLWRAAGSPEPSAKTSPFTDVADSGAYYYKAVLWAAEQGITSGVSSTTFGLNNTLTYDQILTFLSRAAGESASGSDWSAAAVNWAKENGLTDGLTFTAKGSCPRADVVYCLWKQLA